jgi:hypothetical protein
LTRSARSASAPPYSCVRACVRAYVRACVRVWRPTHGSAVTIGVAPRKKPSAPSNHARARLGPQVTSSSDPVFADRRVWALPSEAAARSLRGQVMGAADSGGPSPTPPSPPHPSLSSPPPIPVRPALFLSFSFSLSLPPSPSPSPSPSLTHTFSLCLILSHSLSFPHLLDPPPLLPARARFPLPRTSAVTAFSYRPAAARQHARTRTRTRTHACESCCSPLSRCRLTSLGRAADHY